MGILEPQEELADAVRIKKFWNPGVEKSDSGVMQVPRTPDRILWFEPPLCGVLET